VLPKRKRSTQVMVGLVAVAAVVGLGAWVLGRGKESTDDAQVEGRIVSVSPRVSGQVSRVAVIDNQAVKQGDLLVEIDPKDLDAKLALARADLEAARAAEASAEVNLRLTQANSDAGLRQARGNLTQAASSVQATRSALAQSRAEVESAQAAFRLAQLDLERAQTLAKADAISRADLDARQARFDQARAALSQAQAHQAATEANLGLPPEVGSPPPRATWPQPRPRPTR
jgi:membrane fusion protein (multidrug efflux system)